MEIRDLTSVSVKGEGSVNIADTWNKELVSFLIEF